MRMGIVAAVLSAMGFVTGCGGPYINGHVGPVPDQDLLRAREAADMEEDFVRECIAAGRTRCAPPKSEYEGFYFVDFISPTAMGECELNYLRPWLLRKPNRIRYTRHYWDELSYVSRRALVWHENMHCRGYVPHAAPTEMSLMTPNLPGIFPAMWPYYAREALSRMP